MENDRQGLPEHSQSPRPTSTWSRWNLSALFTGSIFGNRNTGPVDTASASNKDIATLKHAGTELTARAALEKKRKRASTADNTSEQDLSQTAIPVEALTKKTGKISYYPSIAKASLKTKTRKQDVSRAVHGLRLPTENDTHWFRRAGETGWNGHQVPPPSTTKNHTNKPKAVVKVHTETLKTIAHFRSMTSAGHSVQASRKQIARVLDTEEPLCGFLWRTLEDSYPPLTPQTALEQERFDAIADHVFLATMVGSPIRE